MEYYNDRLRAARAYRNVSGTQIAKLIGVSRQQYNKYENGINDMPVRYLGLICEFLDIDANFVLCLTNEMKPCPKDKIK